MDLQTHENIIDEAIQFMSFAIPWSNPIKEWQDDLPIIRTNFAQYSINLMLGGIQIKRNEYWSQLGYSNQALENRCITMRDLCVYLVWIETASNFSKISQFALDKGPPND